MKHVYPVRHPPVPAAAARGETTSTHDQTMQPEVERRGGGQGATRPDPQLPHEHDESSHSQASGSQAQREVGGQAFTDVTSGQQDTDKGPVMDKVYNQKVAPHRSPERPRE